MLRGAVRVLAVSDGVAERVDALGVRPERISLVGNGIDTDVFTPDGPVQQSPGPYVVYAGTMSQWQGVDVFVRAFAAVGPSIRTPAWSSSVRAATRTHLRALAAELCPEGDRVPRVVPPEECARWIRGARAGLVSIKPGIGYDFAKPTKVYAATACGVPAIFAGRGAGNELVERERLGWSVDHDEAAVAGAMSAALTGPGWSAAERERLVAWTRAHASLAAVSRAAAAELARAG